MHRPKLIELLLLKASHLIPHPSINFPRLRRPMLDQTRQVFRISLAHLVRMPS